jgi:cytidylate kinase
MQDIVTIDGPAGAGKSTISKALAKRLGYVYLDTGAMYRAVALAAKRQEIAVDDGEALAGLCGSLDLRFQREDEDLLIFLDNEDVTSAIRSPDMDMRSSTVSAVPEVRAAMTVLQRRMAKGARVVAEGRDMGTVVFPDAAFKFFLTASPEVRAERRYRERAERGETVLRSEVNREMRDRDRRDRTRALAPLQPAPDAHVIDSTDLPPAAVLEEVWSRLKNK